MPDIQPYIENLENRISLKFQQVIQTLETQISDLETVEEHYSEILENQYTTRNVSGRNTYAPPGCNVSDTK